MNWKLEGEKIASLLRSIPPDTIFGEMAHQFLRGHFPGDASSRLWTALSGEAGFTARFSLRGMYLTVGF